MSGVFDKEEGRKKKFFCCLGEGYKFYGNKPNATDNGTQRRENESLR